MSTSRRHLLHTAATGTLAAALGAAVPTGTRTARAQEIAQAPGFYRFRVGAALCTVLSDGNLVVPVENYAVNADPAELASFREAVALEAPRWAAQTNVLHIATGERSILVDCGSGGRFVGTAGHLARNMEAAGIDPAEIDLVVLSHAHPDHCWGLLDEFNEPAYPEAEVLIGAKEHAFWTDEGLLSRMPEAMQAMVAGAQRQLAGVADRLRTFEDGEELAPGLRAHAAFGHTPGHMAFTFESEGEVLFVSADTFNHPLISLARPEWHLGFDVEKEQAAQTRRRVLEMLTAEKLRTLGYHMPWPGLGRVVREGAGFRWIVESMVWNL